MLTPVKVGKVRGTLSFFHSCVKKKAMNAVLDIIICLKKPGAGVLNLVVGFCLIDALDGKELNLYFFMLEFYPQPRKDKAREGTAACKEADTKV